MNSSLLIRQFLPNFCLSLLDISLTNPTSDQTHLPHSTSPAQALPLSTASPIRRISEPLEIELVSVPKVRKKTNSLILTCGRQVSPSIPIPPRRNLPETIELELMSKRIDNLFHGRGNPYYVPEIIQNFPHPSIWII